MVIGLVVVAIFPEDSNWHRCIITKLETGPMVQVILYNYCTSLSAIWCVMEHWKAILTKAEGRGQYCFSVLHNTSYCTNWSSVIVLLHLTHLSLFFLCIWIFRDFFLNSKAPELIQLISYNTCTNSVCTNSYLHSVAFVKLLCHFLFVFVLHHCNGHRKWLAGKFWNF